jgi:hypothetical protein
VKCTDNEAGAGMLLIRKFYSLTLQSEWNETVQKEFVPHSVRQDYNPNAY